MVSPWRLSFGSSPAFRIGVVPTVAGVVYLRRGIARVLRRRKITGCNFGAGTTLPGTSDVVEKAFGHCGIKEVDD